MTITYTEHAKQRMQHRNISRTEVEQTINDPYFTVPSRLDRLIVVKKVRRQIPQSHLRKEQQ